MSVLLLFLKVYVGLLGLLFLVVIAAATTVIVAPAKLLSTVTGETSLARHEVNRFRLEQRLLLLDISLGITLALWLNGLLHTAWSTSQVIGVLLIAFLLMAWRDVVAQNIAALHEERYATWRAARNLSDTLTVTILLASLMAITVYDFERALQGLILFVLTSAGSAMTLLAMFDYFQLVDPEAIQEDEH